MRIALSYHGGDADYEAYPAALLRRAEALGLSVEPVWLAGTGRPDGLDLLADAHGVVLTGGADVEPQRYGVMDADAVCTTVPERDAVEWRILDRLRERPLPLLAICRGAQLLNVYHGGTLIPDLGERNGVHRRAGEERRVHDVSIRPDTRLHAIAGALGGLVNSSHHQAVDRIADGFRISAASRDDVIEAFERREAGAPFMLAAQWHPEGMEPGLPLADRVLDAFLRALS